jgi:predicted protein tyrosine phosphatase
MIFKVLSRERVEYYCYNKNHIVISFRDPGTLPATMQENASRLDGLYLACTACSFDSDNAESILDFVDKYKNEVEMIIVNCELGISRSAGCASALSKLINGDNANIEEHPSLHPNKLIYKLILDEGNRRK